MKTVALLCLASAALALVLLPRNSNLSAAAGGCASVADEQELRRIAEQWKENYNQGNAAAIASLYSSDAYYLTQHYASGIVHPRAMIQAYAQHGIDAHYHLDSIETLYTDCSSDMAYAITRYQSTNAGQKASGVNLVVLRKIAGKWLIVAHESAVPDPATAIQTLAPAPK
jgi:ketosteroid isomerase-like protein